jgi:hypothetical protein
LFACHCISAQEVQYREEDQAKGDVHQDRAGEVKGEEGGWGVQQGVLKPYHAEVVE